MLGLRATALAGFALFVCALPARSATVQFYTVGYFTYGSLGTDTVGHGTDDNGMNFTFGGGTVQFNNQYNADALTQMYTGNSTVTVNNPGGPGSGGTSQLEFDFNTNPTPGSPPSYTVFGTPVPIYLGNFKLISHGGTNNVDTWTGLGFTLEIHQLSPPPGGTASPLASFTGTIHNDNSGGLTLTFGPDTNPIGIPADGSGVIYAIAPPSGSISISSSVPGINVPLDGTAAVPLASTANQAFALLGGLGLVSIFGLTRRPIVFV